jgi:hypothetical protein
LASTSRVPETGIQFLPCRVDQAFSVAFDKWKLDTTAPGFLGTAGKRLLQSASDKVTQFHSAERRFGFDSLEEGVRQVNRSSHKSIKAGLRGRVKRRTTRINLKWVARKSHEPERSWDFLAQKPLRKRLWMKWDLNPGRTDIHNLPHQCRSPSYQDQEDALKIRVFGSRLFGLFVLIPVTNLAVLERSFVLLAKSLNSPSEVAGHPAQKLLSRGLTGKKSIPPGQKASTSLTQPKIGAQSDPIHAVITALQ